MKNLLVISIVFLFVACKSRKSEVVKNSDEFYTCSMHPQVIEPRPGKCPICGMQLIAVPKNRAPKADEIQLSGQQIQLGNITMDTIRNGAIGNQLVLTATLNFDQTKTMSVSSRVMGRVERLYYKNVGDYVNKGVPLYDLYSEELNNAKQEYLLAMEKKKTFGNDAVIDFDNLVQSAKNKLFLWGMSEKQISDLEKNKNTAPGTTFYSNVNGYITTLDVKEGDYVMEGGTIVRLADLSSLWAEAQVYTSQLSAIDRNGTATVQLPDLGKEVGGKIQFVNPEINPDTRINLIRVSIANPGNQLKPGMSVYVVIKNRQRNSLTLPIDAVIRGEKQSSVWIAIDKNSFKNIMVETGIENGDRIEIKSGLKEGDVVVTSGAYLINSEYIFKKGANPMEGMKM